MLTVAKYGILYLKQQYIIKYSVIQLAQSVWLHFNHLNLINNDYFNNNLEHPILLFAIYNYHNNKK